MSTCDRHDTGEHRSLIVLDDCKDPLFVEHTCVCWLPSKRDAGKLLVDRKDATALEPRTWS